MVSKQQEMVMEKKADLTMMNRMMGNLASEALPYLQDGWKMQTDEEDEKTSFIYKADSIEDVLYEHNKYKNFDLNYAMQRYYNFLTSTHIENIFCSYKGCEPEKNEKNKEVDFWVFGEPFDLKVTSYPQRFEQTREDFPNDRSYRNALIQWFYKNQSKEQRNLNQNRLFLVCQSGDGKTSLDNQLLKMNFQEIDELAGKFMAYHAKRKEEGKTPLFNTVIIDGKEVLSDIVFLRK